MQIFTLLLVVALTRTNDYTIALPHANTALSGLRGQSLPNAPEVIERSPPDTLALITPNPNPNPTTHHLPLRRDDISRIVWHDPTYGSRTYITIAPGTLLPEQQIMSVINGARHQMNFLGTGVLAVDARTGWACHVVGDNGIVLDVKHANNHQVTRGVLLAALDALVDYMGTRDAWAECEVRVYDGRNWVGVVEVGW